MRTTTVSEKCPYCGMDYPTYMIPAFRGVPERVVISSIGVLYNLIAEALPRLAEAEKMQ